MQNTELISTKLKGQINEIGIQRAQNSTNSFQMKNMTQMISKKTVQSIQTAFELGSLKKDQIARIFDLPIEIIEKMNIIYRKKGSLLQSNNQLSNNPSKGYNNPPKLSLLMQRFVDLIVKNPNLKQIELRDLMEKRYNITLSQASISRYLKILSIMKTRVQLLKKHKLI